MRVAMPGSTGSWQPPTMPEAQRSHDMRLDVRFGLLARRTCGRVVQQGVVSSTEDAWGAMAEGLADRDEGRLIR